MGGENLDFSLTTVGGKMALVQNVRLKLEVDFSDKKRTSVRLFFLFIVYLTLLRGAG